MRKKAENKIRQAVAQMDQSEFYRIDKVRQKTDIIRKVFDKTILDMDRVGTIELAGGDTNGMDASEIEDLINHGDNLYVFFKFVDEETASEKPPSTTEKQYEFDQQEPEDPKPENVEIVLLEIASEIWQKFELLCKIREEKNPLQKVREMIDAYNQKGEI